MKTEYPAINQKRNVVDDWLKVAARFLPGACVGVWRGAQRLRLLKWPEEIESADKLQAIAESPKTGG